MKRLPVNLASNPVERRRWLRRVNFIAAGVALLVTGLHALLALSLLAGPQPPPPDTVALDELRTEGEEVATLAAGADPRAARDIAVSVGLANALIEQRIFPWAGLFTMLEETLPDDVRLETIQPLATLDGVRLTLAAASASGGSLLDFLGALEARPELLAVYPGRQQVGPDGDLRLSIEAVARLGRPAAAGGQRP